MQYFRIVTVFLGLMLLAMPVFAQDVVLPKVAKITRNKDGEITQVSLAGSSHNRLEITPEVMRTLSKLEHLQSLSLFGTTVNDDDLRELNALEDLQTIDLSYTDITGASLETLASHQKLACVTLRSCDVQDDHLESLKKIPQVHMLFLGRTKITDNGLKHLRHLSQLVGLELSDCKISDNGLALLGELPVIQTLWLSKTIRYGYDDRSDFTDKSVEYLSTLKTLLDLQIADSQMTESGLAELKEALPDCKVSTVRQGHTYLNARE